MHDGREAGLFRLYASIRKIGLRPFELDATPKCPREEIRASSSSRASCLIQPPSAHSSDSRFEAVFESRFGRRLRYDLRLENVEPKNALRQGFELRWI